MPWHIFVVGKVAYDKLKDTAVAIFKATKSARAERDAAYSPEKLASLTDDTFEAPIRRMSHSSSDDSMADGIRRVLAEVILPPHLTTESAKQFFDRTDIRDALREVRASALFNQPRPECAWNWLMACYMELASANTQEAEGFLKSAVALLVASVSSQVEDVGNASMTAAAITFMVPRLETLQAGVDKLIAQPGRSADPVPLDDRAVLAWRVALRTASQPLLSWPSVVGAGAGQHIERPALKTLNTMADQEVGLTCALLGGPGAGKSALMSRLALGLLQRPNATVLAVKADLIGAHVTTERDLQAALGLPELPSLMLRQLAGRGPVYLLLDQLDALADRLDVKTARLSILLTLVRQLSAVSGLHIFLSCRTFEFRHDTRLTTVSAEPLELEPPQWEDIVPVLEANGVSPLGWHADAKEVLRFPQHLNTFLQLKAEGIDEPVSTYQAMLESLWNSLVLARGEPKLHELACEIAEVMADKEELWLATSHFDDRSAELNSLVSARILTRSGHGRIGFSHQTVFDYVLARSFVKNEGSLSAYVTTRMESLFVRPKVLAALTYLRNAQQSAYENEFKAIWALPGLRAHLRYLLLDFLGSQASPTNQELLYLAKAYETPELRPLILKAVVGSKGWFSRLAGNLLPAAMADDALADLCFPLLITGWSVDPETVTRLLAQRWASKGKHHRVTLSVLQETPTWNDERRELAKTALEHANYSEAFAESVISTVGVDNPEVAISMLRWFLDAQLNRRAAEGYKAFRARAELRSNGQDALSISSPKQEVGDLLDNSQAWDTIPALAERLPRHFLERLTPWLLATLQTMSELTEGGSASHFGYALWYEIDLRFDGETIRDVPKPAMLEAITTAVEKLAVDQPDLFEQWARAQASSQFTPVHRLLAHGLTKNPERFAAYALEYILADDRRYFLGTSRDPRITTEALIRATSAHWTEAQISQFNERIKSFAPKRPADLSEPSFVKWWSRHVRLTRLTMRRALTASIRTRDVQRSIDEDARAFPQRERQQDYVGGFIGSPIEVEKLLLASPQEIARAFEKVPDSAAWDHPRDHMRGGNVQLARAFGELAKLKPTLALEVLGLLHPSYGQRAAGEAVSALSAKGFPEAVLMELIVTLHTLGYGTDDDGSFKQSVSQAVNNLLSRKVRLSDALVEVLESWLTREARPTDGRGPLGSDDDSTGKFLLSGQGGLRGYDDPDYSLLIGIVHARYQRDEKPALLATLQRYVEGPHSIQALEGVMDRLGPLAHMSEPAGKQFLGRLLSEFPQLDGSAGPAILMASIHGIAYEEVIASLPRWRDSERLATRKGYGELTALISLVNPKAGEVRSWLSELVREPRFADAREGAAATAAILFGQSPEHRRAATELLLNLIPHNEARVWYQVFELFSYTDKLEPEDCTVALLESIASNIGSAPKPHSATLVERLGTLLPFHGTLVARIASQLIERWREDLSNMGSLLGTAGQQIMDVALTLHRDDATKAEGLKMFEQLLEIDAYQARETLDEIDHRLRPGFVPRLRRLPRRVRKQRCVGNR